jgi:hypothetical protein
MEILSMGLNGKMLFWIVMIVICLVLVVRVMYFRSLRAKVVLMEDIPGLENLGHLFKPVMCDGQLFFEEEIYLTDERMVYDARGELVAKFPPIDSAFAAEHTPLSGPNAKFAEGRLLIPRLNFSGSSDPLGRLIYLYDFAWVHGMMLYDLAGEEPPRAAEFFSLPDLRREADRSQYMFRIDPSVRERLRQAGCVLPDEATPWRPIDTLQRRYEEVIERFVADNRAEAFTLTSYSKDYYRHDRSVSDTRHHVVLPEKGFAFELTPGMNLPELPAANSELPKWDKKRTEVAIRRTGYEREWEFWPIAMIPWWKTSLTHYYKLTIDGKTFRVLDGSKLRVLDAECVDGKIYFSLIDEEGTASLYVYDRRTGGVADKDD